MSRDNLSISVLSERIYKLWPWLSNIKPEISTQDLDTYYEMTYAFEEEIWKDRLRDGADEDESQREIFAVLVCLEFGFDGSSVSTPGLWEFWKQLHEQVICPCFKSGNGEEIMPKYISWPAKTFGLDEGLLRVIWHKVYDTNESAIEEDWISEHFHAWVMEDQKKFLKIGKYNPDNIKLEEIVPHQKKRKPPAPKKRAIPKPKPRVQLEKRD